MKIDEEKPCRAVGQVAAYEYLRGKGIAEPEKGAPALLRPVLSLCTDQELGRLFGRFRAQISEEGGQQ
jgi:hypothetical protein